MEFKKAILIYNGSAGQKDIEQILGPTVPILAAAVPVLQIFQTQEQGHARKLCETYGEQTDLIIILGGDGTVHECINGLAGLEHRPAVAILPGGTCNDFARTLGIDMDLRMAAKQLMDGEIASVDILKVNDHYSLNFWGIGLIAETSMNINQTEKERLGKISYMLSVMRTMKEMNPFKYELEVDGKKVDGEAVMIFVANGKYVGTNPLPFQAIEYDDGLADVFIIKNANLVLLKEVSTADVTVDGNEASRELDHYRGQAITIKTENEMEADMDGEVYLNTPGYIQVLKHHLRILKPQNENVQTNN
ncbi:YegS/Rv2252/BmrU family lipid kinase [Bacillus sp. REN3]|uniref:diacylglycerol/lipid kinase family protein n=1 Tax=Bacillus sp. REN3 TaxID=2802440 RepID=UPI001AEF2CD9|nr:YegS/Rv2252/BmrU family lipid kinase [Bacillus sp. REN3]